MFTELQCNLEHHNLEVCSEKKLTPFSKNFKLHLNLGM